MSNLGDGTAGDSGYDDPPAPAEDCDADQYPRLVRLRILIDSLIVATIETSAAVMALVRELRAEGYTINVKWLSMVKVLPPAKATPIRPEVTDADRRILDDLGIAAP